MSTATEEALRRAEHLRRLCEIIGRMQDNVFRPRPPERFMGTLECCADGIYRPKEGERT